MSRACVAAVLGLCLVPSAIAAPVQLRPEVQPIQDRILVKTRYDLPITASSGATLETTGSAALDRVLAEAGAAASRRVFHRPPRGFRDEAAARASGLDRWLAVRWAEDLGEAELAAVLARASALADVDIAVREQPMLLADTVPNDPEFAQQYALQNGKLNAPKAWDLLHDSTHVVAVIDTGVELTHSDLVANLWVNPGEIPNNGIDDEGNGYVDDFNGWDFAYNDNKPNDRFGHGVHTCGTVGAVTNNANKVSGVCWSVPVMAVKIFTDGGGGDHATSAAGLIYAADNGAAVFSMSWGFFDSQQVLADAVDYARQLDIVQVAAAHNYGSTVRMYPAAYPSVMGIIATDSSDTKTSWSNYGKWCDMAAPGDNILSTYLNDSTAYLSGTSMSTPHVAGAAALVLEANPSLDGVDARWVLNYSAKDLGAAGFDIEYGWGRLDLFAAVEKARMLTASANSVSPGGTVQLALERATEPGFAYFLLPSLLGRRPGESLSAFDPSDFRQVALNFDPLLFQLLLNAGGAGIFLGFSGILDGAGQAGATLQVPPGGVLDGAILDFAFLTVDPLDLAHIRSVSNSVRVKVN